MIEQHETMTYKHMIGAFLLVGMRISQTDLSDL